MAAALTALLVLHAGPRLVLAADERTDTDTDHAEVAITNAIENASDVSTDAESATEITVDSEPAPPPPLLAANDAPTPPAAPIESGLRAKGNLNPAPVTDEVSGLNEKELARIHEQASRDAERAARDVEKAARDMERAANENKNRTKVEDHRAPRQELEARRRSLEKQMQALQRRARQGNIDLDLYATPRPQAETLFFEHTRSPDGYYFKDHRSSPQREYEFIEFESPVDVWQVQAMVNLYEGTAPGGASGEIRIEFEGKIFAGQFSLPAMHGNKGRSGRNRGDFWTRIDVPTILKLPASRREAALARPR